MAKQIVSAQSIRSKQIIAKAVAIQDSCAYVNARMKLAGMRKECSRIKAAGGCLDSIMNDIDKQLDRCVFLSNSRLG